MEGDCLSGGGGGNEEKGTRGILMMYELFLVKVNDILG